MTRWMFAGVCALCLFVCAPFTAYAAGDGDAAELLSRLKEKYNDVDNLSLDFNQRTVFAVSGAVQEAHGSLVIGRDNRYRITMEDRVIVSDGKTVWSWSKPNAQVIVDGFRDDPAGLSPERLLTRIPEDYRAVLTGTAKVGDAETSLLKLTPGSPGGQVKSLKLWVDEGTLTVLKLQVLDLGGNETTYLLGDIVIDADLPDSAFVFTAPAGAEVIDLR